MLAPHCSARAAARVEQPNAEPRRPCWRYARAACAAASTAATRSPRRSNSSETEANCAAPPSRRASANRAATPARGPSTIPSARASSCAERSPNWVAVCGRIASAADSPGSGEPLGRRQHDGDRLARPRPGPRPPMPGPRSTRSPATEMDGLPCRVRQPAAASSVDPRTASAVACGM